VENYRLPKAEKERLELAVTIGADGDQLLAAVDAAVEQPWLAQLPAIHVLREVWTGQYIKEDGQLRWRTVQEMPATAEQISSPYDPEARYSKKRDISWTGYKAHLTETCDPETPHVITNVETTLATTPDDHMLTVVHQSLAKSELLAGARRRRVQQGGLSRRLGSASRDLPRGQAEYLLAAEHLSQGRHAIRGPLRAKRLRRLPDAKPLHSVEGRAAYHHAAGA
jgi:hypothetical protein